MLTIGRCSSAVRCLSMLALMLIASIGSAAEPKDVVFRAKHDGSEQRYVELLPDDFDAQQSHWVLLALHGHGSDRWQFIKQTRDECKGSRDVAAKHRMIFVAPDYRAATSWMGPAAEADTVQIIEELKQRHRVTKVIVSGGSMGGTSALTFAALHPELVDAAVSLNGMANHVEYSQFQDAIAASFGGNKQQKPDEYRRRSAELAPDKLKMPIAFTTGGNDKLVPPDSVLRLHDVLLKQGRPVKLIHRPTGGHSTNYADTVEAFEFVIAELKKMR